MATRQRRARRFAARPCTKALAMARRALLLALLMLLGVTAQAMAATDHIIERAVFEDVSGTMDIGEVVGQRFETVGPLLTRGYAQSVHWMRLTVRPAGDGGDVVLRIRPTFLDEVTLYAPAPETADGWRTDTTGDRTPYAERSVDQIALGFRISPSPDRQVFYLRIETTNSTILSVSALDADAARLAEWRLGYVHAAFFGMMGLVLVWALGHLLSRPEPAMAWFTVGHTAYVGFVLASTGYMALLLPAALSGHADWLTNLFLCTTPLLAMMLHRAIWLPLGPPAIIVRIGHGLILASVLVIVLFLSGLAPMLAMQLNALVALSAAPFLLLVAFSDLKLLIYGRKTLRIVYSLQALLMAASMLPLLGVFGAAEWSLNMPLVHGILYTVLMFALLQQRAQWQLEEAGRARHMLGDLRGALVHAQRQRESQDRFMAMLTHEIRTPLSVIGLNIDERHADAERLAAIREALAEANAIVENATLADRLDHDHTIAGDDIVAIDEVIAASIRRFNAVAGVRLRAGLVDAITSDRQLVETAVNNLLDNALKHSAPRFPVTVRLDDQSDGDAAGVAIVFENRPGRAGFPDPDRVFDKFYRASGTNATAGSGLGLYVVQGIADLLGGSVRYEPKGGMVRFVLWLPQRGPVRGATGTAQGHGHHPAPDLTAA